MFNNGDDTHSGLAAGWLTQTGFVFICFSFCTCQSDKNDCRGLPFLQATCNPEVRQHECFKSKPEHYLVPSMLAPKAIMVGTRFPPQGFIIDSKIVFKAASWRMMLGLEGIPLLFLSQVVERRHSMSRESCPLRWEFA